MVTGSKDDSIRVWTWEGEHSYDHLGNNENKGLFKFTQVLYHSSMVNDVFLTTDLSLLFSASDDTTAKVWKFNSKLGEYSEV